MRKYVFVTGGVVSGLGKGITAASLGRLLKSRGLKVMSKKLDPYINVDPGTMSPIQHGEVFVTDDGAETDLDLGHYERFIDEDLNKYSNITSGKVYWNVLNKERKGEYLGNTVQVIPHITDEIKSFIYNTGDKDPDVVIVEIGGTVGDIESQPFLEAIRQVSIEQGRQNCCFIHVTLVPYIKGSDEHKSKPTQHSVKELQGIGIAPDIIILRADEQIDQSVLDKISMFCNVKPDCVIQNITLPVLYEAPLMLERAKLSWIVCRELGIDAGPCDMQEWEEMVARIKAGGPKVRIAIVGKYIKLHDAYLSVAEAIRHGGFENGVTPEIKWVEAEELSKDEHGDSQFSAQGSDGKHSGSTSSAHGSDGEHGGSTSSIQGSDGEHGSRIEQLLGDVDGILVPGGFGERGIDEMILAAQYAREHDVPFLGICLGMQICVMDFARHVCGIPDAYSGEFDKECKHKVIDLMPDQYGDIPLGGTMRLGAYPCVIKKGTLLEKVYGTTEISERHRHRYEFNNDYRDAMESNGMEICGTSPDGRLVEQVALPANRFHVGVQYHPELKSRPNHAHPLFREFIKAASEHAEK
ncbi:MAG: CTP synthase [Eubacterium sp.]|nr:CTP synthase [Eubacterium sp.]